jgi:predicted nucleotidyltransferase
MSSAAPTELKEAAVAYRAATAFPTLHNPRYPVSRVAFRLEPYLRAIVEKARPDRIILFGSHAYGTPTEHSDFDLLVIRRGIASSKESNLEIRRAFWDVAAPPESFTLLSQTPEGLEQKLRSGSFIYREIMDKGVEVYAA